MLAIQICSDEDRDLARAIAAMDMFSHDDGAFSPGIVYLW